MIKGNPQRKPGIESKTIGSETLLYNENGEEIHVLNSTAALIWDLSDGGHTPRDIESALRNEYDIPADHNSLADIERTIRVLVSKNLLTVQSHDDPGNQG